MNRLFQYKFLILAIVVVIIAALALAGCGQTGAGKDTGKDTLSGTVTTAGSTSVQPLSEELAKAFMTKNPGVRVEVSGGGSSAGVKAVQTKTADIGAASRKLKDSETGVKAVTIALDGIAVIVHPDNPVSDLTLEQIKNIFLGQITNWKDVNGNDAEIVVVNREEGSGTRGAFHELVVGEDNEFTDKAIVQNSTGAVREAVSQDVNAIGYISLGAMNNTVKNLKVDGVEATVENIKAEKYPIARPLNYVLNESTVLSEAAQAYLDFVLSDEGQNVVKEMGFIPVK